MNTQLATLGVQVQARQDWPAQLHVLTHRDLFLHPVVVDVAGVQPALDVQDAGWQWQSPAAWPQLGLPAPVRKLLQDL